MTIRNERLFLGAVVIVTALTLLFLVPSQVVWSAHPSPVCPGLGNPHATLKVWETQPDLGNDPVEAVEDPLGLSGYFNTGLEGPTLINAYENTTCNNLPCGLTWWAPDINKFRCMGFGGGVNTAISLDNGGPDIILPDQNEANDPFTPGGPFDHVGTSVGRGSVWTFGSTTCPVAVTLRGDQSGADGAGGTGGVAKTRAWPVGQAWGGDLDEVTGLAYYTDPGPQAGGTCVGGPFPGFFCLSDIDCAGGVCALPPPTGDICRINPANNARRCWDVGGNPAFLVVESPTAVWASLSSTDEYVRLNPTTNQATYWAIPGGPFFLTVPNDVFSSVPPGVPFEIPDGIDRDSDGNIWAVGTVADAIARLKPEPINEICSYTKAGLNNPQLLGVTGAGATRQVFFTEGDGDAISILTEAEADDALNPGRSCALVVPVTLVVGFVDDVLDPIDKQVVPEIYTIIPEVFDLECEDGFATCNRTCEGGAGTEVIPAITRCSVAGARPGVNDFEFPEGMTGVYRAGEIAGSFNGTDDHFTLTSCAIIAPPPTECDPDPRTQGYWHRQCLGAGLITPGRNGRGPKEPNDPDFKNIEPAVNARLSGLIFNPLTSFTCEDGMDASPPSDPCQRALKQYTALLLNIASDKLQENCNIDLSAEGCNATNIGDLVNELAALINSGDPDDCKQAAACAGAVNENQGIVPFAPAPVGPSSVGSPIGVGFDSFTPTTATGASATGSGTADPQQANAPVVASVTHTPVASATATTKAPEAGQDAAPTTAESPSAYLLPQVAAVASPVTPAGDQDGTGALSAPESPDPKISIERHLAVLADASAAVRVREVSEDALLTALSGGFDPDLRLRIVRGLLGNIDVAYNSLLAKHLEDIRDEAREFGDKKVAREAARLLKSLETPQESAE